MVDDLPERPRPTPRKTLGTTAFQAVLREAQDLRNLAAQAVEGRGFLDLEILCSPGCSRFVPAVCVLEPMDLIDDAQALEEAVSKARKLFTRIP